MFPDAETCDSNCEKRERCGFRTTLSATTRNTRSCYHVGNAISKIPGAVPYRAADRGLYRVKKDCRALVAFVDPEIQTPLHEKLLGRDPRIRELNEVIVQLADTHLAVFIAGETGTGKDIVAKLLHELSNRREKPFVKVNCPAIPKDLFESELLGFERGAFTGALSARAGRFELARDGTIFLDEIAEIPVFVQIKLLQILDGEPYMRIGGTKPLEPRARVVAATNIPLEQAIADGRLRKDIAFRLSETVLYLPPLRQRRGDIPLLAEHFNFNACKQMGKPYEPLDSEIVSRLQRRDWPGNVRELAGRIKEYLVTGVLESLVGSEDDANESLPQPNVGAAHFAMEAKRFPSLKEAAQSAVEAAECALIEEALRHTRWNRRQTARLLKTSYSSLLRRIDAYHIGKNRRDEPI